MSLLKQIRKDPQYATFLRILETTRKNLDTETATAEAKALHASRTSRSLSGKDRYSSKSLIDANLRDLSTRARLVEIRVTNDRKLSHLKEAAEALKKYVSTEYVDELKSDFSTAGQRSDFVDRVLKSANALLAEGESLLSVLDFLIKDIDQASHSMRHVVDCLKLLENKHGSKAI